MLFTLNILTVLYFVLADLKFFADLELNDHRMHHLLIIPLKSKSRLSAVEFNVYLFVDDRLNLLLIRALSYKRLYFNSSLCRLWLYSRSLLAPVWEPKGVIIYLRCLSISNFNVFCCFWDAGNHLIDTVT